MEYTRTAEKELDSQESMHRMTRDEIARADRLATRLAWEMGHDQITVPDIRYAATVLVIQRLPDWDK